MPLAALVLDGFPQLVKLYFKKNIKTASSFPRLAPIISQVLLPSSARLPEHFCHLGKGEGNENREVEKVDVEGRRGRGEGEDRGVGRGGGGIESAGGRLTWLTNWSIFS